MQIKQHTTSKGTIAFVKVPDYLNETPIIADIENTENEAIVWSNNEKRIHYDILPQGKDWQLIGLLDEATEEQAAMVVDLYAITRLNIFGYKDYISSNENINYQCFTLKSAKESLTSLITSLGFKQDDNVLILEKI